jgi:hypothetical protein
MAEPDVTKGLLRGSGDRDSKTSMRQERTSSFPACSHVPAILVSWLEMFRRCFSGRVWQHILVLVAAPFWY